MKTIKIETIKEINKDINHLRDIFKNNDKCKIRLGNTDYQMNLDNEITSRSAYYGNDGI